MALFREPGETITIAPFKRVSVFLSGEFLIGEKELLHKMEMAGVLVVRDITEANVVIVGGNQQLSDVRERMKCKLWYGWDILTITEELALEILSRAYTNKEWAKINGDYWMEKVKSFPRRTGINITYDRLFNTIYSPIVHFTDDKGAPTLEGKEVFMFFPKGCDSKVNDPVKLFLERQGAIVKDTFDPAKTDYCLLRESTLEQLKEGKQDDFIQAIEDGYNSSSCNKFLAEFILESEVLALMKRVGQE